MADGFSRILFMALYNFSVVPQPTEHTHPPQDQGVVTEAGRTVENFILSKGEAVTGLFFLRDTPVGRPLCLHEQVSAPLRSVLNPCHWHAAPFAGQRTATGFAFPVRSIAVDREGLFLI